MTITTTRTVEKYVGDGSQSAWPITFPFFKGEDIKACIINSAGKQINLTYGTDYTVTRSNSSIGGVLHYVLGDGVELTIWLSLPIVQGTDFYNTGPLNAEVLEAALDRLTLIAQQLQEASDRSVKVETSSTTTPEQLLTTIYAGRDTAVASASAAAISEVNAASSEQAASTSKSAAASSAITAEAWAEGETPPDPNDTESKSAKTWAMVASDVIPIASTTYAGKIMSSASLIVNQETGEATVPTATTELAGIVRQATTDEAEAGVDNSSFMTPLKMKTVINAQTLHTDLSNVSDSGKSTAVSWGMPDYPSQIVLSSIGPNIASPSYDFDAFVMVWVSKSNSEAYEISVIKDSHTMLVGKRTDDYDAYTQTTSFYFFLPKGWKFRSTAGVNGIRVFPLQGSM